MSLDTRCRATLRIPPTLAAALDRVVAESGMCRNALICMLIENYVKSLEKRESPKK
jgi:metal-responsive CopG/Arc/MetJ family transcriptional regulator